MKTKGLVVLCLLTSLMGYLEWGGDQSMFLFQSEWDIILKLVNSPRDVLHPFILLPLFGQLLLFISLFSKSPNKTIIIIGLGCIGILLGFMFVIGLISMNFKILASTLPFLVCAALALRSLKKKTS